VIVGICPVLFGGLHRFTLSPGTTKWRMSRDPNIAGFHLAVASTGGVESQSIANFDGHDFILSFTVERLL